MPLIHIKNKNAVCIWKAEEEVEVTEAIQPVKPIKCRVMNGMYAKKKTY